MVGNSAESGLDPSSCTDNVMTKFLPLYTNHFTLPIVLITLDLLLTWSSM